MGDFDSKMVTAEIAGQVLWYFDVPSTGQRRPGSFSSALLLAIASADPTNQARLGLGFPGYVRAVQTVQLQSDGIDQLRRIAEHG